MIGSSEGKNTAIKEQALRKHRILVAPLDWGLGHATRCIPLIKALLEYGYDVWIATDDIQEELLKEEFPQVSFLKLEGYKARYARTKAGLFWQMLIQSPRFLRIIKKEHIWLREAVKQYSFDLIISDNRFGLWHADVPSIFITHQLAIRSPFGKWSSRQLQKRNYNYINKHKECWVPDFAKEGLAGELSHPGKLPAVPVRYVGPQSRFQKGTVTETKGHLLIILSGPEPQRTLLENKVVRQLSSYVGTATVVRGLPGDHTHLPSTNMLSFYNHLPSSALEMEMQKAEFVISRSGYSTIMDIATMGKKSILIPTPGQTEQEYLGRFLMEKQLAFTVQQDEFSLEKALANARKFNYQKFDRGEVENFLEFVKMSLIVGR